MQTSIIRAVTSVRDLALANVTTAEIEIDGGGRNPIPVRELARALSRIKQGEVSLTLTNASQIKATPVSTSYEISFRIADGDKLKHVELAFSDKVMSTTLTRHRSTNF